MPNLQMATSMSSLAVSERPVREAAQWETPQRETPNSASLSSQIATNTTVATLRKPKSFQWPAAVMRFCQPIQEWLDEVEVHDAEAARLLYNIIPGQCPFERDVNLLGRTIFHIPPLCKLNPFYEQLVALRFRAMCYLVDECGESL